MFALLIWTNNVHGTRLESHLLLSKKSGVKWGSWKRQFTWLFWQVQKPGVDRVLKADLGFLFIAARTLEFLSPELATWLVSEHHFVQTFSDSFLNERLFIFVPQCYCCPPQGSSPATTCPSQTVMYLISSHQPLAYYAFLHEWPLS